MMSFFLLHLEDCFLEISVCNLALNELLGSISSFLQGLIEESLYDDFLMTDLIVSARLFSRIDLSLDFEMGDEETSFLQTGERLTSRLLQIMLGR